ncbi:MAG: hypothetical protein ACKOBW_18090 [Planctomycetota bacterium]
MPTTDSLDSVFETTTPEFVLWSLGVRCALRDDANGEEPTWVERQLRSLRACGTAVAEGRLYEGYCWEHTASDPATVSEDPLGFSLAEVLAAYGEAEWLDEVCGGCAARVAGGELAIVPRGARTSAVGQAWRSGEQRRVIARWAGCFGWIDWSSVVENWDQWVAKAIERRGLGVQIARHFTVTQHAWYGLFTQSALSVEQRELLAQIVDELRESSRAAGVILADFAAALGASAKSGLPLSVFFGPAGRLTAAHWTVLPHCGRCKVPRAVESRRCGECGQPGAPVPARRRYARGPRPYGAVSRMMSRERLDALLTGYWRQQISNE